MTMSGRGPASVTKERIQGECPLHLAVERSKAESVKLLIAAKANVHAKNVRKSGWGFVSKKRVLHKCRRVLVGKLDAALSCRAKWDIWREDGGQCGEGGITFVCKVVVGCQSVVWPLTVLCFWPLCLPNWLHGTVLLLQLVSPILKCSCTSNQAVAAQ